MPITYKKKKPIRIKVPIRRKAQSKSQTNLDDLKIRMDSAKRRHGLYTDPKKKLAEKLKWDKLRASYRLAKSQADYKRRGSGDLSGGKK